MTVGLPQRPSSMPDPNNPHNPHTWHAAQHDRRYDAWQNGYLPVPPESAPSRSPWESARVPDWSPGRGGPRSQTEFGATVDWLLTHWPLGSLMALASRLRVVSVKARCGFAVACAAVTLVVLAASRPEGRLAAPAAEVHLGALGALGTLGTLGTMTVATVAAVAGFATPTLLGGIVWVVSVGIAMTLAMAGYTAAIAVGVLVIWLILRNVM